MPASEIDDIFSGKVSKAPIASTSKHKLNAKGKGKTKSSKSDGAESQPSSKKSKKRKSREEHAADIENPTKQLKVNKSDSKKAESASKNSDLPGVRVRVVETVHDPSSITLQQHQPKDRPKFSGSKDTSASKPTVKSKKPKEKEDLQRFADSRGTGPRQFIALSFGPRTHRSVLRKTNGRRFLGV